jgi:small subunit ribosomal protein S9
MAISKAKPSEKSAAKPAPAPEAKTKIAREEKPQILRTYGTGRRKDATARVWITRGSGKIVVNGRAFEHYFPRAVSRMVINQPFAALNVMDHFDVLCTVSGGGLSGQAGALRLGISRALCLYDPTYHGTLRQGDYMTRDPRAVERKKYGRRKARRSFQFSKR